MVTIVMTLTTPNCPSAEELPGQVENAVAGVSGVHKAKVNIVWDPPWDTSRMSDEARWCSICGDEYRVALNCAVNPGIR